ncbi:cysteine hydrolase family protein [Sporosarcina sp. G11-34]|uniref:cysteine hydrolase family protein n=1 Tax=Sporosarcina sp. G11-34 TaxID=2849605 RepID=UPI0022A9E1EF|nr:isochorismatase family cysteine hydrolase [Sporosarcina sp. G11-34]MCZ2257728.1 cysteine hydrolase [Sporosarcina sp. G11-34]
MKKALLNIDYTNDFVATNGKLTCGEPGQKLLNYICNLTKTFIDNNDLVVFPIDLHTENDSYHPESKQFPPHNIENTTGRELYSTLNNLYQANRDHDNVLWFDKTRFSAFTGTNLELKLRERGIIELHLVGVCTDICILHTAVDAYNKGFKIVVHEQGVASFNQAGHDWALGHFKNTLGAEVI